MSDSIDREIELVGEAIARVEREIAEVNEYLKSPTISDDDKAYYRQEKADLRQEKTLHLQKEADLRRKELLLLERTPMPSIPENQRVNNTAFPEDLRNDLRNDVQNAVKDSLAQSDRATPLKSPAQFGAEELKRLKRIGKVYSPDAEEGKGDAVLTEEQASSLWQLKKEHHVVAFLTPFLTDVFQCDGGSSTTTTTTTSTRVLVNSEEHKWLKTSNDETSNTYNKKPDMFVCHKSLYKKRDPFNAKKEDNTLRQLRRSTDNFGLFSHWELRRFLSVVLEAKLDIDNAALGQTVNYGSHLSFGKNAPLDVRLVLFDRTSFWLVETVKGASSCITKCQWVDAGSKSRLEKILLQDPLIEVLDKACIDLGVVPEMNGYLGGGAFGLVFKVHDQNGDALALKIVPDADDNVAELARQMEITNTAKEKCPDLIVGVKENSFRKYKGMGAVLLYSEVGDHYSSPSLCKKTIIDCLDELHDNNVVHGDARVENIVSVNGKPKWIDLRRALFFCNPVPDMKEQDSKDLMESINRSKYFN